MISFNLKGLGEFVYSICPFTADAKSIKILKSFYYWVYSIDVCQTDVLLAKEYDTPKEFIHLSIYICGYDSGRFRLEQLTDRGYFIYFFHLIFLAKRGWLLVYWISVPLRNENCWPNPAGIGYCSHYVSSPPPGIWVLQEKWVALHFQVLNYFP
jgi:hypothetical protein